MIWTVNVCRWGTVVRHRIGTTGVVHPNSRFPMGSRFGGIESGVYWVGQVPERSPAGRRALSYSFGPDGHPYLRLVNRRTIFAAAIHHIWTRCTCGVEDCHTIDKVIPKGVAQRHWGADQERCLDQKGWRTRALCDVLHCTSVRRIAPCVQCGNERNRKVHFCLDIVSTRSAYGAAEHDNEMFMWVI